MFFPCRWVLFLSLRKPLPLICHWLNHSTRHLHKAKDLDLTRCVPLVLHGDDADSHRRRSFCILTFGSLLVSGVSMWDSKYVMYIMDNSRAVNETFSTLDLWCMWSLTELQLGTFLDVNPFGQQHHLYDKGRRGLIAGGWRGIVVYHKGDEKYIQRAYKASHSAVSKNVCLQCLATSSDGPMVYTHHGPSAPHRATKLSTPAFIEKVVGVRTWVALPGWDISMLAHDWLHVVDLSLVPEAAASTLVELVDIAYFGAAGTADERLRLAFTQFTKACKQAGVRNRGKMFSMILGCHWDCVCAVVCFLFVCVCVLVLYVLLCLCSFVCVCVFGWLVGWLVGVMWLRLLLLFVMFFLQARKHLYPGGPKSYPTLAQKHFNAAVSRCEFCGCMLYILVGDEYDVFPTCALSFFIFFMFKHNAQMKGSCGTCEVA